MFEGKRTSPDDRSQCHAPVIISLPPGDLELLLVEYKATPESFEQEAARSIEAALREWNEEIAADDEAAMTAGYPDHEEYPIEPTDEEQYDTETD